MAMRYLRARKAEGFGVCDCRVFFYRYYDCVCDLDNCYVGDERFHIQLVDRIVGLNGHLECICIRRSHSKIIRLWFGDLENVDGVCLLLLWLKDKFW